MRWIAALLFAVPAAAQDLPCIPHGELVAQMAARGQVLAMSGGLADGRKLEAFANFTTGLWTVVVVDRPKGNVTKTSCSRIFGEGDPGVMVPAK